MYIGNLITSIIGDTFKVNTVTNSQQKINIRVSNILFSLLGDNLCQEVLLMKIERPNANSPTPEELQDLARLKKAIEQVTANGKVSKAECERIKGIMWADGKITPEELELCRTMIYNKITAGELEWEY